MKRWLAGVGLGILLGWIPQVAAQAGEMLDELLIPAARGETLNIPSAYGALVSVAVSSEVHHLYFQDKQGTIRIVLVGPKGAVQRARHGLQLLSQDVYVIERKPTTGVRRRLTPGYPADE